jgi:hypothetical protein
VAGSGHPAEPDLARGHGVDDFGDTVRGQRRVKRAGGPECVLGIPPVNQGFQAPAAPPEADGGRRGDRPRAGRRIGVQRSVQDTAGAAKPVLQGHPAAWRGGCPEVTALVGDGGRGPQVALAEVVGKVIQRPVTAVLDRC